MQKIPRQMDGGEEGLPSYRGGQGRNPCQQKVAAPEPADGCAEMLGCGEIVDVPHGVCGTESGMRMLGAIPEQFMSCRVARMSEGDWGNHWRHVEDAFVIRGVIKKCPAGAHACAPPESNLHPHGSGQGRGAVA